jgi:hypothetical protein
MKRGKIWGIAVYVKKRLTIHVLAYVLTAPQKEKKERQKGQRFNI